MATETVICSYHDPNSFCSFLASTKPTRNFSSLFHLNAQSLRNKHEEIGIYLNLLKHKFSDLAFTETWFSSEEDVVSFDGYNTEYLYRHKKRGGGVALYIKEGISHNNP